MCVRTHDHIPNGVDGHALNRVAIRFREKLSFRRNFSKWPFTTNRELDAKVLIARCPEFGRGKAVGFRCILRKNLYQ